MITEMRHSTIFRGANLPLAGVARRLWIPLCSVIILCNGRCLLLAQSTSIESTAESHQSSPSDSSSAADVAESAREIIDQRQRRDQTVWKAEVDAQAYEQVFLSMWDELRARRHDLDVIASVALNRIAIPTPGDQRELEMGIVETSYASGERWLDQPGLASFLAEMESSGYKLHESEWHHSEFEPARGDSPASSRVSFLLHATGPNQRLAFRGQLDVRWTAESTPESPQIDSVRVIDMKEFRREGPPAFEPMPIDPPGEARLARAQPVLVYDVDGDGLSEIALGESNAIYRNLGNGSFSKEKFLHPSVGLLVGGIIADFDRDGRPDFVCIGEDLYLTRFEADEGVQFQRKGIRACPIRFDRPQAFSAGDVDGDGDLDLWVGQYMPPFVMGQLPTPYYDANDGFPDYLLINDGKGNFTDGTAQSQLLDKVWRRTYAGSLVDLNGDRALDLVVVSDFSGVDVYYNDGAGRFTDVTSQVISERHTFGMGHALADFDLNGKLDLYVIGMSSTTARRLSKLGLGLEEYEELQKMRPVMGYGNRMYLDLGTDQFAIPAFNDQVARTGWSWGASGFDFDNDGDKDIYVANGHRSGESCQDYCTTYWRHDIYLKPKGFDEDIQELLGITQDSLNSGQISWNGYEHNKLFMNRDGKEFVDVAWLLGVAFEEDCRAVVTDDLDGDGRVDLLVTEYKTRGDWDSFRLKVLKNNLVSDNHWIGVRLHDSAEGGSAIGASVTVKAGERPLVGRIVTGDSFTAQHASVMHFGLGDFERVEALTVQWADGRSVTLDAPAIDRYHDVTTDKGG